MKIEGSTLQEYVNVKCNGFTFIVVAGSIAWREEQMSSVVHIILQRQAHVACSLLIRIATGRKALRALETTAAATARFSSTSTFSEVLPKHQIHRGIEMRVLFYGNSNLGRRFSTNELILLYYLL